MPKLIAIAAMAENRAIGRANKIPWHLPEEFKWFKETTLGHVLIMGRKTFESIGRPLPKRTTIVVSRSEFKFEGVLWAPSVVEAIKLAGDRQAFVCGGAQIYEAMLPLCYDIYLTVVKQQITDADTFLPEFESKFKFVDILRENADFIVKHYSRQP